MESLAEPWRVPVAAAEDNRAVAQTFFLEPPGLYVFVSPMNRRNVAWAWLMGWAVLMGCFLSAPAAEKSRPNILLMMADDMGFSDLGCYGSEIATPNLDQLAAGGLRFTQFYNTARCCPTRAALLTGLYPHQAGVGHMVESGGRPLPDHGFAGYKGDLSDRAVTIAEALRLAGYHTAMAGKWHVTPFTESKHNWPLQRGFEKYYGIIHGASSYYDPASLTRDNQPARTEGGHYYLTDAISDNAARYIGEFGKQPQPFFLYVAFTAPHWPLHALPEDIAKYKDKYLGGWDALREARHKKQIELGLVDAKWPLTPRDKNVSAWTDAPDQEWQAHRMAVYAAQIDRLDQGIGKILARLKEAGADNNTLVLFLADNGGCAENLGANMHAPYVPEAAPDGSPMRTGNSTAILPGPPDTYASYGPPWANVSNTPFRLYKHWVHEGGIATPLIAWWPATIKKRTITAQPGHLIDLMATCLDVAGASYPKSYHGKQIIPLEGKSLLPIFQGKTRAGHEEIYWEHEGNRAVRQGKWKLVSRHPGEWELYDMEADRTELNNLAVQHPEKVRELAAKFDVWAKKAGVVPWEIYNAKKDAKQKSK